MAAIVRIGIIGAGAIGTEVAVAAITWPEVEGIHVLDIDPAAVARLLARVPAAQAESDVDTLIDAVDIVVEAANVDAARDIAPRALARGCDVLMMSIGCLVDSTFKEGLRNLCLEHGRKLWLPSGAIAAIDGIRAGALAGIKSVTLVTTKPPAGLGVEVDQWTVLFEGTAREAIARYPKNVNVAVCLSLAGLGVDQTRVQVVADPLATHNQHKLIVEGAFGRIRCEIENLPSPDNPKTSYLASLSAIATLRRIIEPIQIGS